MKGIGIRLLLIAVVAGGAFILRDRLSGNAGDLQVGDCFDITTSAELVDDVQHHPCTEAHIGEVVHVRDYDDADTLPTEAQWQSFVETHCVAAFNAYTGLDFLTDPVFDMGYLTPSEDSWKGGDREVTCYASRIDGAPMSASVKASP